MLLTIGKTSYTVTVVAPPGVRGDPPPLLEIRPSSDPQPHSSDAVGAGCLLRADLCDLTPADERFAPRCHSHSSSDSDRSLESDRQPSRRGNGADAIATELTLQSAAGREFSARCALTRYDATFCAIRFLVPAKYGQHLWRWGHWNTVIYRAVRQFEQRRDSKRLIYLPAAGRRNASRRW